MAGALADVTVSVASPCPSEVRPRALVTLPDSTVADTALTLLVAGCSR